jgi:hypothetical protein
MHGLAAIILNATPELKKLRAAKAVRRRPPPVYLKVSLSRLCSATDRESRVSLFKTPSVIMTTPATPAWMPSFQYSTKSILNLDVLTAVIAKRRHENGGACSTNCLSVAKDREFLRRNEKAESRVEGFGRQSPIFMLKCLGPLRTIGTLWTVG